MELSNDESFDEILAVAESAVAIIRQFKWFMSQVEELLAGHPIEGHMRLMAWSNEVLSQIERLLGDHQPFYDAMSAEEAPGPLKGSTRGRGPVTGERLRDLHQAQAAFAQAVVRWGEDPTANWHEIEAGSRGLLRAIFRFDPHFYRSWVSPHEVRLNPPPPPLRP